MSVNVEIKEVENLSISADDETVTVTGNEPDKVDEITITQEEIQDIVRKQIEESNAEYCDMTPEQIIDLVDEFRDKDVDLSKFDYNIYSRDFYAERFPGFEPRFYECLERASHEKFVNQEDKKDWRSYSRENGDFTVSFGGTEESKDDETYSDALSNPE